MERQSESRLLSTVWCSLDGISPTGEKEASAATGFVTAVSINGSVLRVLLRVPADLVRSTGILGRVKRALSSVPELDGVALHVKPYRPAFEVWRPEPVPHDSCVASAMAGLIGESGWVLDRPERPGTERYDRETFRVIARAEVVDHPARTSTAVDAQVH